MNKLRRLYLITASAVVLGLGLAWLAPARGYALFEGAKNEACAGVNLNDTATTCTDSSKSLADKVSTALNILSIIVGIIAVIMIIVGGLKFITAGGDPSSIASARTTILYAIIGLVVVALSQVVVLYVLGRLR